MKLASVFAFGGASTVENNDGSKEPAWLSLLKFLLLNVGGKVAGVIASVIGLVWLIAPELHGVWADRAWRLLQACIIWLIACIFWQQKRNSRALITSLAQKQISDPTLPNTSPDEAVDRAAKKMLAEKNGVPRNGPTEI